MQGLLIADKDLDCRKQMAEMFIEAGYNVIVTNSAANALEGILKNNAQVVLLGSEFDELSAADLIPLLKKCNRKLNIILVTTDTSLPLIRKLRSEGIFYHALKPVNVEDREEIRQAVSCAFERLRTQQGTEYAKPKQEKEANMKGISTTIITAMVMALAAAPAFASNGSIKVYNSGILVLAFLGFCALVVVIQLIPAIITLCGMLKGMARKSDSVETVKAEAGK